MSDQASSMATPQLLDELVEEVLLRFPPDDPASLVRAALVCKRWHRLVSGRRFRRRFRGFHRTPPMLGAIVNRDGFVPTSSCQCQVPAELRRWMVLDARHGRVLFHKVRRGIEPWDPALSVWDPITDEQLELPKLPRVPDPDRWSSNFAVLCAATGCNHLDCSHGPYLVVVVAVSLSETFARVYSSEDGEWSEPTFAPHINDSLGHIGEYPDSLDLMPGALVGDALYFLFHEADAVLKFDLTTREMVVIHLPVTTYSRPIALITTEDGRLGFAGTKEGTLYLWSRMDCPNEEAGWAQSRVIELETMLPANALSCPPIMIGSVGVIFLYTNDGVFSVDIESSQARKMPKRIGVPDYVVPFVSFCTPALGVASTDDEPRVSASSAWKIQVASARSFG